MRKQIKNIADNIEYAKDHCRIHSPVSGSESLRIDWHADNMSENENTLCEYLYEHYYAFDPCLFQKARRDIMVLSGRRLINPEFAEALKTANPGTGYKDLGWKITEVSDNGDLFVQKKGINLYIKSKAAVSGDNYPGKIIHVRFPKESIGAMPGFYFAFSNKGRENSRTSTRIYLNLKSEYATQVVNSLLKLLLQHNIRYTLKIINNPAFFKRRDNTVLYIARTDFDKVQTCLQQTYNSNLNGFKPEVPGFTYQLTAGISVADNPVTVDAAGAYRHNVSFGQHRVSLLVKGIIEAASQKIRTNNKIFLAMCRSLTDAGIDPDRPYLNSFDAPEYNNIAEG